jgi:hypothetical protein
MLSSTSSRRRFPTNDATAPMRSAVPVSGTPSALAIAGTTSSAPRTSASSTSTVPAETAHGTGLHALALGYVEWALANPGAYQLLFESADRLGHRGGPGTPGWDMIESLAELLARDRAWDPERSQHVAVRLWACLHGLVSLRIHKPGVDWPTTPQHEAGQIVRALLEAG